MRHFSRTLLLIAGSCCLLAAINAFAIHENKRDGEDFDFEFDEFADGVAGSGAAAESISLAATADVSSSSSSSSSEEDDEDEELEPHAEMLPANFENVEPPGVDHMEMTAEVLPNAKMMREYHGRMVEV